MEKKSIVIVEDEIIIAEEVKSFLIKQGYHVAGIASRIDETMEMVKTVLPDLVLMDIQLKGKTDGIVIAKQIYSYLNIPIIFVTAYDDSETIQRAKLSGAFNYITKPIDYKRLHTTIEFALFKHEMVNQVRHSEERYFGIVNTIDILIFRCTIDGQINFANKAMLQYFDRTLQETIGYSIDEIIPDGQHQIAAFKDTSESSTLQYLQTLNSGPQTQLWIQWTIHGIYNIQNQLVELQWIGKDITAFKLNEKHLEEINKNLDREVHLKTQDLIEANIKQQKLSMKLAEAEKLATLGLFNSIMVHEINNFLSNIFNKMFLLEKQLISLDTKNICQEYIVRIRQQLSKMSNLTQDVLFFVKPRSYSFKKMDLKHLINTYLEDIDNQDNIIKVMIDDSLPMIQADPLGLEIVFKNLLQNAIHAIDRKGTIHITLQRTEPAWICMSIQDNGSGIKTEDLPKIFNPFFSTRHDKGGTGLGLVLCKRIIEDHKGTISIQSEKDQGTTVAIQLPVGEDEPIQSEG